MFLRGRGKPPKKEKIPNQSKKGQIGMNESTSECAKIAHRRSLALFTADESIARNSASRTICTHFLRRRNRGLGSLAILWKDTKEYLNQRGTKIRVFRERFRRAPFLPPQSPVFPPSFPFKPCSLSHHFSPLHLPLYPPFFDSLKTPI